MLLTMCSFVASHFDHSNSLGKKGLQLLCEGKYSLVTLIILIFGRERLRLLGYPGTGKVLEAGSV